MNTSGGADSKSGYSGYYPTPVTSVDSKWLNPGTGTRQTAEKIRGLQDVTQIYLQTSVPER